MEEFKRSLKDLDNQKLEWTVADAFRNDKELKETDFLYTKRD